MNIFLKISGLIDGLSTMIGKAIVWLILATVLLSTGNALARKIFSVGSNAFTEMQWYLYGTVFLLGAGYALLRNAHVRIDFVSSHLTPKTRSVIDIIGILFVLAPLCFFLLDLSWPLFANAFASKEMSSNPGGLIRWPVYLLLPTGMTLLLLQSFSELIKRIAFLLGIAPDPISHKTDSGDTAPAETEASGKEC